MWNIKYMKFNQEIKYLGIIFLGVVFGILVLLPLSEFASYLEYIEKDVSINPLSFIGGKVLDTITLNPPLRFIYYSGFGILSSGLFILVFNRFKTKSDEIIRLQNELQQGLLPLIAQGESHSLEFKSTYRYDLAQKSVNKVLESVIMKTIAGFMNSEGGTLLIGVSDDGTILGLENDYQTLKRKDSDGFEQLIMNSVSERMGTAANRYVRIIFHSYKQMEVCRIIVARADFPVYVKEVNNMKFFARTGSGAREMDIQEAIKYISHNWKK
ncbi:MAG: ATP-binding protein [Bacteroidales bacterium]|nr:ATP-binding protein [Bacteroidales bacterium]